MKSKAIWVLLSLVLVHCATSAVPPAFAGTPGHSAPVMKRLTGQIDYWFVGDRGLQDDEGRTLIWEGTIKGDLNGTMKWWFGPSPAPDTPFKSGAVFYYAARWEIWDPEGKKLLLAGDSAGKTVAPVGEDGIWDGHGVVTKARKGLRRLRGRPIYETGPVIWEPRPAGTGIFVIY